jgi:hypothetical protein
MLSFGDVEVNHGLECAEMIYSAAQWYAFHSVYWGFKLYYIWVWNLLSANVCPQGAWSPWYVPRAKVWTILSVSPWYASNNILLHGDDNYVWTYNNIVEIYWGNLVSEFGNNIWKKLSDYTCCKQMETKIFHGIIENTWTGIFVSASLSWQFLWICSILNRCCGYWTELANVDTESFFYYWACKLFVWFDVLSSFCSLFMIRFIWTSPGCCRILEGKEVFKNVI